MRQKNQLHFKECMIQGLCENSMVMFGQKDFLKQKRCSMMAQSPRALKARMGKLLKGLRHYDLTIGNLQDK
ncbi:hypothetical protein GQ457_08G037000 [Hibiscus cannabinus]